MVGQNGSVWSLPGQLPFLRHSRSRALARSPKACRCGRCRRLFRGKSPRPLWASGATNCGNRRSFLRLIRFTERIGSWLLVEDEHHCGVTTPAGSKLGGRPVTTSLRGTLVDLLPTGRAPSLSDWALTMGAGRAGGWLLLSAPTVVPRGLSRELLVRRSGSTGLRVYWSRY
jgi:hypothetical protein